MNTLNNKTFFVLVSMLLLNMAACNDYLNVMPPEDELTGDALYKYPGAVESVVTGLYPSYFGQFGGIFTFHILRIGTTADELAPSDPADSRYGILYANSYVPEDYYISRLWANSYPVIYTANSIIENVPATVELEAAIQAQYEAEARFMRAFIYFNLVMTYGDVPLVLTTDPAVSMNLPRTPKDQVMDAIQKDLEEALQIVPPDFEDVKRANIWAIRALLARVYLYQGEWDLAESMAGSVIDDGPFSLEMDLNQVFKRGNPEAIFAPVIGVAIPGANGQIWNFARGGLISSSGEPALVLNSTLVNAFEAGDERMTRWVDKPGATWHAYKYKNSPSGAGDPEDLMVLRLAEQHLIRAEARARQGNVAGANSAESDLNVVRNRAGLGGTTATTQEEMLDAIMQERRIELFAEGQRWYDLKRTGRIDSAMKAAKGASWSPHAALWPVPYDQIIANPQLNQNDGY